MREPTATLVKETENCYHCGDTCTLEPIFAEDKAFCCAGCKSVYEILYANNLCTYYNLEQNDKPGTTLKAEENVATGHFNYLDSNSILNQLLNFQSDNLHKVSFRIPGMHCSSCIWLLENLFKLDNGVLESRVNFPRKEVSISYHPQKTKLSSIVTLLHKIGYAPTLNLDNLTQKSNKPTNNVPLKLGLAGFCFGNIMLLSFPEYFALADEIKDQFGAFFGYLSIALALTVLLFSARGFFESTWQSLKQKHINLDAPISLGLLSLFGVSLYEIITSTGPGFLDSFTGLVFFMLIGKYVQQTTYDALAFDRDYKAYFPIAVTILEKGKEKVISVKELTPANRIRIRNQEIVPADAILLSGRAFIDYSFVSGESVPLPKVAGEIIYAGGRQVGESIELEVIKEVSQSYLTQLWNNTIFEKDKSYFGVGTYADKVGTYFIAITLLIALGALIYWLPRNTDMAIKAFTSVLVIACPCALSLSTPFTLSNVLRIFGHHKFYLKNGDVAETLAKANTIVFDKTGTLTESSQTDILYQGKFLGEQERSLLKSVLQHSTHPLSQSLYQYLHGSVLQVSNFQEVSGGGITGLVNGVKVKIGSLAFTVANFFPSVAGNLATQIFIKLDDEIVGAFTFSNHYRIGLQNLVNELQAQGKKLAVLSGDNNSESENLVQLFGDNAELHFNQTPTDKLQYIAKLKSQGQSVIMVGDGLNDAGIAVTNSVNGFSPGCDAILDAGSFTQLAKFLLFSRRCLYVIMASFGISFIYNIVGLSLAVTGQFSPVVSAILMPISSLSVILVSVLGVRFIAWRMGFSLKNKPA